MYISLSLMKVYRLIELSTVRFPNHPPAIQRGHRDINKHYKNLARAPKGVIS